MRCDLGDETEGTYFVLIRHHSPGPPLEVPDVVIPCCDVAVCDAGTWVRASFNFVLEWMLDHHLHVMPKSMATTRSGLPSMVNVLDEVNYCGPQKGAKSLVVNEMQSSALGNHLSLIHIPGWSIKIKKYGSAAACAQYAMQFRPIAEHSPTPCGASAAMDCYARPPSTQMDSTDEAVAFSQWRPANNSIIKGSALSTVG